MDGLLTQPAMAPGLLSNGMVRPGNIDLNKRLKVNNKDGSFSTVESMSVNINGAEWLIPTIREDGKRMSNDEAVKHFQSTGKHLGVFASPDFATEYAKQLSARQGRHYMGEK